MFAKTVFYAFNGRRPDSLSLRPNDAIHWQAVRDASRAGYRYYDFGEVLDENQGLSEFKSKWGSEEVALYRYYFPAGEVPHAESSRAPDSARQLAYAAWRRLPLRVTALLGDQIYRYL
jgi:lipid II:glycine glycyltransferase (peptidoglycan interpeptide bridge formation enzyme)